MTTATSYRLLSLLIKILVCILLGQTCLFGKEPWMHLGSAQGLNNLTVNEILKGPEGYIWVATDAGLKRYDGERFLTIESDVYPFISHSKVSDIYIDEGRVYLALLSRGLFVYKPETRQVEKISLYHQNEEVKQINHINQFQNKFLLSTDDRGLLLVMKDSCALLESGSVPMSINLNDSIIISGSNGSGLKRIIPFSRDTIYLKRPIDIPTTEGFTCDKFVFISGKYWMACWDNALHNISNSTNEITSYLLPGEKKFSNSGDEIVALEQWNEQIILATKYGQILSFDITTNRFLDLESTFFSGKKIYCLYVEENNLWVGTSLGIYIIDLKEPAFKLTKLVDQKSLPLIVNTILGKNESIYLGTMNGLYRYFEDKIELVDDQLQNESIHSLLSYKTSLYIGSNKSVYEYSPYKPLKNVFDVEIIRAYPNYFEPREIQFSRYTSLGVQKTENGDMLWAVPYGHFISYKLIGEDWAAYVEYYNDVKENLNNKIVIDNENNLHILAKRYGWYADASIDFRFCKGDHFFDQLSFKGKHFLEFPSLKAKQIWSIDSNPPLPGNDIRTFHQIDGKIYLGTSLGLIEINGTQIPVHHKLPFNDIKETLLWKGNLWIVANGRLMSFDPKSKKTILYDQNVGLDKDLVITSLFAENDRLFIGGNGFFGSASFQDLNTKTNYQDYKLKLNHHAYLKTGKNAKIDNNTILSHEKDKGLNLGFSALVFPDASDIIYSYRIPEITDDWIDNGTNNDIILPNLKSGEHTLYYRAHSPTNNLIDDIKSVTLIIQPYWYKTWWFIGFCVLGLFLLSYLIYRFRINNILAITKMRDDISQDLHDDVGSILSSISIYADAAETSLENKDSLATKNILLTIGEQARITIEKMSDIVWSFRSEKDSVLDLFERMEVYGNSVCSHAGIDFQYTNDVDDNKKLDMKKRKNTYLIFKEFLQNSLKHGQPSIIELSIRNSNHGIEISIKDNGSGFDLNQVRKSGFGLITMKKRAKEIEAEIQIDSIKKKGTSLTLWV